MKLCSYRATLKKKKGFKDPNNLGKYKIMKNKLVQDEKLVQIFEESDKSRFEEICPLTSIIGYYKDEKFECFIAKLSKFEQNENPVEVFLIVEEKKYEKSIHSALKKINKAIKDENIYITTDFDYIKLYLVDKDGLQNSSQRLKSFLNFENITGQDKVYGAINVILLFVSIILMFFHWHDQDDLWKSIYISSTISFGSSLIFFLVSLFCHFKKLIMDFEEIWEPIGKTTKTNLDADENSLSTNDLNFSVTGDK